MTSDIRVGREVKNGQKTLDVINGRSPSIEFKLTLSVHLPPVTLALYRGEIGISVNRNKLSTLISVPRSFAHPASGQQAGFLTFHIEAKLTLIVRLPL